MAAETPYSPTANADRDREYEHAIANPSADPSALTIQLMYREIASLKEIIFTRLDAMDRAMTIFQDNLTRVPTDTDKQIASLRSLVFERFDVMSQKFAGIDIQFRERAALRDQAVRESKEAIQAAFRASKELVDQQNTSNALAIAKSETSTVKQLDGLQALLRSSLDGVDDKIENIKERVTGIEERKSGAVAAQATTQGNQVQWVGIIGMVLGGFLGIAGLVLALSSNGEHVIERSVSPSATSS